MFSHFSVGGSGSGSVQVSEVSQRDMCVFLSPCENQVSVAAPSSSYHQETKGKAKPIHCKCPEQNMWKMKQVLETEMCGKKKIQHLTKQP